jgi:hypothetical protein
MRPLDAAADLKLVRALIMSGTPLAPSLRIWICAAIDHRLKNPASDLDHLLGLRSRAGGRLHAASTLPGLHRAIAALHPTGQNIHQQASSLAARITGHRRAPDPTLMDIERRFGRLPGSPRQLARILAGQTESAKFV